MKQRPTATTSASTPALTTLLLPRLSGWVSQLATADRYPALECVLARADSGPPLAGQLDLLRLKIFGITSGNETLANSVTEVPVAALGLLAAEAIPITDRAYHLRLDPITLQADISRVMMMQSGFSGFPADYRQQVQHIVKQVLAEDGLELHSAANNDSGSGAYSDAPEYWTITLAQSPGIAFTPLDEALGADISECLPEGDNGRRWKRLSNDIQMALHASPANEQRRQRGEPLINGVWFWGGGNLPVTARSVPGSESVVFDQVYSMDPVISGLARLHGIAPQPLISLLGKERPLDDHRVESLLVDWALPAQVGLPLALQLIPDRLEAFCASALTRLKQQGGMLELHSPERSWQFKPGHLRRFWCRPKPLIQQLGDLLPLNQEPL